MLPQRLAAVSDACSFVFSMLELAVSIRRRIPYVLQTSSSQFRQDRLPDVRA